MLFSADDKYVITVGGHDKTVLIWETDFSGAAARAELGDDFAAEEDADVIQDDHADESKAQKLEWKVRRRQEI